MAKKKVKQITEFIRCSKVDYGEMKVKMGMRFHIGC